VKRSYRGYVGLLVGLAVAIGGWRVAWGYITDDIGARIDGFVAEAARGGITIDCAEREISGWPFRVRVDCRPFRLRRDDGTELSFATLRAVALVYKPRHIIVEADAPAEVSVGGAPPGAIAWALAHASLVFDARGAEAVSIALTNPRITGFGQIGLMDASATAAQLHYRRSPSAEDSVDLALKLENLTESPVALGAPIDVEALTTLAGVVPSPPNAATLKASPPRLEISSAKILSASTVLAAEGTVSLNPSGRADGQIALDVTNAEAMTPLLGRLVPVDQAMLESARGAITGFGKKTEQNGVVTYQTTIGIEDGTASFLGMILSPKFQIPALRAR